MSGSRDPISKREYDRAYRLAHPERAASWRAAHPEYNKDWRNRRPGYERARHRADAMRARIKLQTYRARQRAAFVERINLAIVWKRDGGLCGICGKPAERGHWDLDHIIPMARGGLHCYANVQVSHPPCNRAKGDRLPGETENAGTNRRRSLRRKVNKRLAPPDEPYSGNHRARPVRVQAATETDAAL